MPYSPIAPVAGPNMAVAPTTGTKTTVTRSRTSRLTNTPSPTTTATTASGRTSRLSPPRSHTSLSSASREGRRRREEDSSPKTPDRGTSSSSSLLQKDAVQVVAMSSCGGSGGRRRATAVAPTSTLPAKTATRQSTTSTTARRKTLSSNKTTTARLESSSKSKVAGSPANHHPSSSSASRRVTSSGAHGSSKATARSSRSRTATLLPGQTKTRSLSTSSTSSSSSLSTESTASSSSLSSSPSPPSSPPSSSSSLRAAASSSLSTCTASSSTATAASRSRNVSSSRSMTTTRTRDPLSSPSLRKSTQGTTRGTSRTTAAATTPRASLSSSCVRTTRTVTSRTAPGRTSAIARSGSSSSTLSSSSSSLLSSSSARTTRSSSSFPSSGVSSRRDATPQPARSPVTARLSQQERRREERSGGKPSFVSPQMQWPATATTRRTVRCPVEEAGESHKREKDHRPSFIPVSLHNDHDAVVDKHDSPDKPEVPVSINAQEDSSDVPQNVFLPEMEEERKKTLVVQSDKVVEDVQEGSVQHRGEESSLSVDAVAAATTKQEIVARHKEMNGVARKEADDGAMAPQDNVVVAEDVIADKDPAAKAHVRVATFAAENGNARQDECLSQALHSGVRVVLSQNECPVLDKRHSEDLLPVQNGGASEVPTVLTGVPRRDSIQTNMTETTETVTDESNDAIVGAQSFPRSETEAATPSSVTIRKRSMQSKRTSASRFRSPLTVAASDEAELPGRQSPPMMGNNVQKDEGKQSDLHESGFGRLFSPPPARRSSIEDLGRRLPLDFLNEAFVEPPSASSGSVGRDCVSSLETKEDDDDDCLWNEEKKDSDDSDDEIMLSHESSRNRRRGSRRQCIYRPSVEAQVATYNLNALSSSDDEEEEKREHLELEEYKNKAEALVGQQSDVPLDTVDRKEYDRVLRLCHVYRREHQAVAALVGILEMEKADLQERLDQMCKGYEAIIEKNAKLYQEKENFGKVRQDVAKKLAAASKFVTKAEERVERTKKENDILRTEADALRRERDYLLLLQHTSRN